jgi:hypothetical protein
MHLNATSKENVQKTGWQITLTCCPKKRFSKAHFHVDLSDRFCFMTEMLVETSRRSFSVETLFAYVTALFAFPLLSAK